MSESGSAPAAGPDGQAAIPEGLVPAVVSLVSTGPVLLGAYTTAELAAVDAVVDFLESRPSDEVLAAAVADQPSTLRGIHHIERGYHRPFEQFASLGLTLHRT